MEMSRNLSTMDAPRRRSGRRAAVGLMLIGLMAVVAVLRLAPSPVRAATEAVTIKDFSFKPTETKVKVGDTVTWTNRESSSQTHTVIQDDGAWSSDGGRTNDPNAEIKPGSSFTHTFDKDDVTFGYHCRLHTYMTGKVIVGKGSPAGAPPPPPPTEQPAPTPTPNSGPLPPLPKLPLPPPLGQQPATGRTSSLGDVALPVRTGRTAPAAAGAQPAAQPAYTPTELPQGVSGPGTLGDGTRLAPYTTDKDGVKEFHLRMAPITWTTTPGNTQTAYAFNGTIPGPVIRVNEGDRLRMIVTNDLPVPTSVHWHGMILPNEMDGVPGITQPLIAPGTAYTYAWTAVATGTHWYHTHTSGKDEGLGLYGSLEIVPRTGDIPADHDYRVMIGDTYLGFVLNGKGFPYTYPLKAKVGERVHIRVIDTGDQVHPIHLHGFPFQLVARDGIRLAVPEWMDTTLIGTGQTLDIVWTPMSPGNWLMHCHIFSHAHDDNGMMGLVTVLEVAPSDKPVAGVPPALPALPTPNPMQPYSPPTVPQQLAPLGLPPLLPAGTQVAPRSGGLLGGNETTVLIAVGLLLAYRLGGRYGHPRGRD
jgi:FtsP/CotA-like multicopper oxidase with cupredoxin domain